MPVYARDSKQHWNSEALTADRVGSYEPKRVVSIVGGVGHADRQQNTGRSAGLHIEWAVCLDSGHPIARIEKRICFVVLERAVRGRYCDGPDREGNCVRGSVLNFYGESTAYAGERLYRDKWTERCLALDDLYRPRSRVLLSLSGGSRRLSRGACSEQREHHCGDDCAQMHA